MKEEDERMRRNGQGFRLAFDSVTGRWYAIRCTQDLQTTDGWAVLVDGIPGTGREIEKNDANAVTLDKRHYRIKVQSP
jgi:hypothetical protein